MSIIETDDGGAIHTHHLGGPGEYTPRLDHECPECGSEWPCSQFCEGAGHLCPECEGSERQEEA